MTAALPAGTEVVARVHWLPASWLIHVTVQLRWASVGGRDSHLPNAQCAAMHTPVCIRINNASKVYSISRAHSSQVFLSIAWEPRSTNANKFTWMYHRNNSPFFEPCWWTLLKCWPPNPYHDGHARTPPNNPFNPEQKFLSHRFDMDNWVALSANPLNALNAEKPTGNRSWHSAAYLSDWNAGFNTRLTVRWTVTLLHYEAFLIKYYCAILSMFV